MTLPGADVKVGLKSRSFAMPLLSVIVPTRNERDNISPFIDLLRRTLAGVDYEVIIVDDDSPDNTARISPIGSSNAV